MSMENKHARKMLDAAYEKGVLTERGRVLWLMDDERTLLRAALMKVILVEQQRHVLQTKIRLAVAIFEKLKMRMMAGDEPPATQNTCPKCGLSGYRYSGSCPDCDDVKSKEKPNGEVEDPLDEGATKE
jgi:hypothetical protein